MKLAIIGSRSFNNFEQLKDAVVEYYPAVSVVISGGARGADALARRYAQEMGLELIEELPDWSKYRRAAGPVRNRLIVEQADAVLAFWDGRSRGTAHAIREARRMGKVVTIIRS